MGGDQKCPNVSNGNGGTLMMGNPKARKLFGRDLNCERGFCDPMKHAFAETIDESGPVGFRATDSVTGR